MGRIFGTDGVRGIANEKLDVELALAISRAAGMIIKAEGVARPKILVGRDTRLSGEMLQCAVAAGLSSVGCDVELLGVVPTGGGLSCKTPRSRRRRYDYRKPQPVYV